ncbi:MAG: hypothetical protein EDR02_14630 [Actinobacteria bacterium]|nr:MAG: hypothetical protein EDR02_14630 [Actinomycetota bacterium]RIK06347.1 MAG: hypothetical protein DCC48_07955 [Acidobacteriota bacterium]
MDNVMFLGVAALLSIIGTLVLWLRSRKPHRPWSGMQEFDEQRRALADGAGEATGEGTTDERSASPGT